MVTVFGDSKKLDGSNIEDFFYNYESNSQNGSSKYIQQQQSNQYQLQPQQKKSLFEAQQQQLQQSQQEDQKLNSHSTYSQQQLQTTYLQGQNLQNTNQEQNLQSGLSVFPSSASIYFQKQQTEGIVDKKSPTGGIKNRGISKSLKKPQTLTLDHKRRNSQKNTYTGSQYLGTNQSPAPIPANKTKNRKLSLTYDRESSNFGLIAQNTLYHSNSGSNSLCNSQKIKNFEYKFDKLNTGIKNQQYKIPTVYQYTENDIIKKNFYNKDKQQQENDYYARKSTFGQKNQNLLGGFYTLDYDDNIGGLQQTNYKDINGNQYYTNQQIEDLVTSNLSDSTFSHQQQQYQSNKMIHTINQFDDRFSNMSNSMVINSPQIQHKKQDKFFDSNYNSIQSGISDDMLQNLNNNLVLNIPLISPKRGAQNNQIYNDETNYEDTLNDLVQIQSHQNISNFIEKQGSDMNQSFFEDNNHKKINKIINNGKESNYNSESFSSSSTDPSLEKLKQQSSSYYSDEESQHKFINKAKSYKSLITGNSNASHAIKSMNQQQQDKFKIYQQLLNQQFSCLYNFDEMQNFCKYFPYNNFQEVMKKQPQIYNNQQKQKTPQKIPNKNDEKVKLLSQKTDDTIQKDNTNKNKLQNVDQKQKHREFSLNQSENVSIQIENKTDKQSIQDNKLQI